MAKYDFYFHAGCRCSERSEIVKIPDDELDGLSKEDQETLISKYFEDWLWDQLNCGWEPIREE